MCIRDSNVLEASVEFGVKGFVYAASSSCYGIPDQYPTPETAEIRPQYPYALTKHIGEELVMHWAKVYELPALSLRFFNVYGPRSLASSSYSSVISVFLKQKKKGVFHPFFWPLFDNDQTANRIEIDISTPSSINSVGVD